MKELIEFLSQEIERNKELMNGTEGTLHDYYEGRVDALVLAKRLAEIYS